MSLIRFMDIYTIHGEIKRGLGDLAVLLLLSVTIDKPNLLNKVRFLLQLEPMCCFESDHAAIAT